MVLDKIARLHLLMQQENVPGDPVEIEEPSGLALTTVTDGGAVPSAKSLPEDPAEESASLERSSTTREYGVSESSDDDYAVRRPPSVSSAKLRKARKARPSTDLLDQENQDRMIGDLGPLGAGYCPILAVAKYPYRFMKGSSTMLTEKVASRFFTSAKIWNRKWTIYFIYPPLSVSIKPLFLVPAKEFQTLLAEINEDLGLQLAFPSRAYQRGFLLDFLSDDQPQPRFLGTVSSQAAFKTMASNVPADPINGSLAEPGDQRDFLLFEQKMNAAMLATQATKKASKETKKFQRVQEKEAWGRSLRRTQRYLGLRPRSQTDIWSLMHAPSPDDYAERFDDYVQAKDAFQRQNSKQYHVEPLDTSILAPFSFDQNVVFVCVDIEAWERDRGKITEIGISTLDTADLNCAAPGIGGVDWMAKIRPRHFRIKENAHFVNKDFLHGCPDRFEKCFGTSEFISIQDAPKVVASCFKSPFSATSNENTVASGKQAEVTRNIVLVGHDTKNDIQYLRDLGYDPGNLSSLTDVLDTVDLFRAFKYESQPAGLGNVLLYLRLQGWNLHNAGNDAAYTLQAMIGIALKDLQKTQLSIEMDTFERLQKAKENAVEEAAEEVAGDVQGWKAAWGNDDGGPGAPIDAAKPGSSGGRGGRGGARGRGGRGGRGPRGSG